MATKLSRFKVPAVPERRRSFERSGRKITPLAGPEIEIPGDQDEYRLERYIAWNTQYNGSLPEFIVWEFLTKEKKLKPMVDFLFQSPFFGGRTRFGGFVADYVFPMRREIWQVQGLRWHLLNTKSRAHDELTKTILTSRGYKVLELYEDDLLNRPGFVLDLAWDRGAEVPSRRP